MNPDCTAPTLRESAPYGKACIGCSKAKCRCLSRVDGSSCERCHRLGKDCQPSQVVRRRLARKPAHKTAQLEEKLNDLVTLLKSRAAGEPHVLISDDGFPERHRVNGANLDEVAMPKETRLPLLPDRRHQSRHQRSQDARDAEASRRSPDSVPFYLTPQGSDSAFLSEPSASQAEQYLRTFRDTHLRTFPFIHISPSTT